jgi:hypothetical protein
MQFLDRSNADTDISLGQIVRVRDVGTDTYRTPGAIRMDQKKTRDEYVGSREQILRERQLIVAYLSYALDDVRELGGPGLHLLQMTIAAIADNEANENSNCQLQ